jgi:hypothetical protein
LSDTINNRVSAQVQEGSGPEVEKGLGTEQDEEPRNLPERVKKMSGSTKGQTAVALAGANSGEQETPVEARLRACLRPEARENKNWFANSGRNKDY